MKYILIRWLFTALAWILAVYPLPGIELEGNG